MTKPLAFSFHHMYLLNHQDDSSSSFCIFLNIYQLTVFTTQPQCASISNIIFFPLTMLYWICIIIDIYHYFVFALNCIFYHHRLLSKHFCLQPAFFSKIEFFLLFAKSVNLCLQIAGKCISDTLFNFKEYVVHQW